MCTWCDGILVYYVVYFFCMGVCLSVWQYGYIVQWVALLDVMIRNETARQILAAVITPARQLGIAAFLSLIFTLLFSMLGFFFFNEDYPFGECETLRSCFITTLNQGIRSGGGIGEYMRQPDPFATTTEIEGPPVSWSYWSWRTVFDLCYFIVLVVIMLNLVFGIIIDTFAERRFERQEKLANKKDFCFVCDISARRFDQVGVGFHYHTHREHNYQHLLFYLIYVFEQPRTERSAAERYVHDCWARRSVSWLPWHDAFSLPRKEAEIDE